MPRGEIVDQLVADFRVDALPSLTRREIPLPSLQGKIDSVVGMRRSGKTWRLYQEMQSLAAQGVPPERLLYVNFEDERLLPFSAQDLQLIPDALYRRYPDAAAERCWFFLDEIQNVPDWEVFVRRQVDASPHRFVVTGSSARLLSREIATSLRGRALATEVLPFSFREFLAHRNIQVPERWPPDERGRSILRHELQQYLSIGGFPEVQSVDAEMRARVLQSYLDVVLLRDIVERHEVSNLPALRYLVRRLLRSPAGRFTVNRFFNDLRSQGLRIGKDTLHEYLRHLEDAFLVFLVPIHTESERRRMVNPRKCYLVDHVLAHALSFSTARDLGHLLENVVYLELRRRGYECRYVVTESGFEVDFLGLKPGARSRLIQVCADPSASPQTWQRELRACAEASRELDITDVVLITMEQQSTAEINGLEVPLIPAWRWLAELE